LKTALAIHGGAGARRKLRYEQVIEHMTGVVEAARDELARGAAAIDVAVAAVAAMEMSGLYVAGKGGSPNAGGEYELDACVMEGVTGRAGAVACMRGYQSPVRVARAVMERTPHVLLAGPGAEAFARSIGAEPIPEGEGWHTHAGAGEANYAPPLRDMGTVGCVALDQDGRLAAANSTAGVFDKTPGRIGDTPLIGAGAWADRRVAVSCTGQGEIFMRVAAAAQLAFLVREGRTLEDAAAEVMSQVAALGGEGGLIAVDAEGDICVPYNAEGMKRATLSKTGDISARVFDDGG
jgi:isoaspartyl peptidase/L-asparaginase-like protein (Ntn-hydrolase superfamily)